MNPPKHRNIHVDKSDFLFELFLFQDTYSIREQQTHSIKDVCGKITRISVLSYTEKTPPPAITSTSVLILP